MKKPRPDKNSFFGNREDGARTKPARESSASSRIVQDICAALFDDTLHPGDYLGAESDLVEHYGVSRGPVRDALRTLEAFGVVDIRVGAHGGIFVASGDPTRFSNTLAVQLKLMQVGRNDLLDSLSAIEEFAVDLAAQSATQEELDRLSDIIGSLKDVTNPEEFTALSFEFHSMVATASHNPALVIHVEVLRHILTNTFSSRISSERMKRILAKDRQLLKLLKDKDGEGARKLIRRHWERVKAGTL